MRIGINGFGRIGRVAARIIADRPGLQLAAINSRADAASHAYLLANDSTYGRFGKLIEVHDTGLLIDTHTVAVFQNPEPADIPWDRAQVDIVIDATGKFLTVEGLSKHKRGTVRSIVLSAPAADSMKTIVVGVNEKTLDPKQDFIVSNSSCTTNCLAVVLKVLHEAFPIKRAVMQTVHAMTDSQNLLDNSHGKEKRLGRAACSSIIPSSTGSSRDIAKLFPDLAGKITCQAVRVPVETVSFLTLTAEVSAAVTKEEVNDVFRRADGGPLSGILQIASEELVSRDFTGSPYSAIVDPYLTTVTQGALVTVSAWYDNEWGYTSRLVDVVEYIGKRM